MRHDGIMNRLVAEAKGGPNTLGFLLFGSVATGTHREDSDIDVVTVLRKSNPSSGISNAICDGIKVGEIFFAYQVLTASVETVPYLPHPLAHARLLFDRDKSIEPLLQRVRRYFAENPAIVDEWNGSYPLNREEEEEFGFEQTTIIDVWNELENAHSGGSTKRQFLSSFQMTRPSAFRIFKKLLFAVSAKPHVR